MRLILISTAIILVFASCEKKNHKDEDLQSMVNVTGYQEAKATFYKAIRTKNYELLASCSNYRGYIVYHDALQFDLVDAELSPLLEFAIKVRLDDAWVWGFISLIEFTKNSNEGRLRVISKDFFAQVDGRWIALPLDGILNKHDRVSVSLNAQLKKFFNTKEREPKEMIKDDNVIVLKKRLFTDVLKLREFVESKSTK